MAEFFNFKKSGHIRPHWADKIRTKIYRKGSWTFRYLVEEYSELRASENALKWDLSDLSMISKEEGYVNWNDPEDSNRWGHRGDDRLDIVEFGRH